MPSRRRLLQTLAALPLALPFAASIPGVIRQALAAGDSPIRSGLQKSVAMFASMASRPVSAC